jgi:hypothetical protein
MTSSDSRSALPHFVGFSAYRVRRSQSTGSVGLPNGLTAGAETGLSYSHDDSPTIPRPLRRRVLRGCTSKRFTPSMAFAPSCQARLPVAPLRAFHFDAADFASCCGLVGCTFLKEGSTKKARPHASTLGSLRTPVGCYRGCLAPPLTGPTPVSRREPQDAPRSWNRVRQRYDSD